jgi:CubicO group peptidase (beta-lactamase class C family)
MRRRGAWTRTLALGGAAALAIAALALVSSVTATPEPTYQSVIEAAWPADGPGGAALVARGDEVLYLGARGVADLEHRVPLDPEMVFRIGSITKQFTAVATLMLAERGKLSLDDPLTKLLPDYPEAGAQVTVRHLLTHTSGIFSYTSIPGYMATGIREDVGVAELIDRFKDLPPAFPPGERFAYNNSGYVLLGAIIERVSGVDYATFVENEIFEPLGMQGSCYGHDERIVAGRVSGYQVADGEVRNAPYLSMTQPYAAGSLMSTAGDLLRWNTALFGGEVIGAEWLRRMTTPATLDDGEETTYGLGLWIREIRGRRALRHGGGIYGFDTHVVYLPAEEVFVAVLSNRTGEGIPSATVSNKLAAIAIGDPFPEWEEVEVASDVLRRYTGVYRIDERTERVVTLEDGDLHTQRDGGRKLRVLAASETRFFYEDSLNWFEMRRGEDGRWRMLTHQLGAEVPEEAVRVGDVPRAPEPATPDAD